MSSISASTIIAPAASAPLIEGGRAKPRTSPAGSAPSGSPRPESAASPTLRIPLISDTQSDGFGHPVRPSLRNGRRWRSPSGSRRGRRIDYKGDGRAAIEPAGRRWAQGARRGPDTEDGKAGEAGGNQRDDALVRETCTDLVATDRDHSAGCEAHQPVEHAMRQPAAEEDRDAADAGRQWTRYGPFLAIVGVPGGLLMPSLRSAAHASDGDTRKTSESPAPPAATMVAARAPVRTSSGPWRGAACCSIRIDLWSDTGIGDRRRPAQVRSWEIRVRSRTGCWSGRRPAMAGC